MKIDISGRLAAEGGGLVAFSVLLIFFFLAIYDVWVFGEALKPSCNGVDRYVFEYERSFPVIGGRTMVKATVDCKVVPGEDVVTTIAIQPEQPGPTDLQQPLVCSAELQIDEDTTLEGAETTITEFGEFDLEPVKVPKDTTPGSASLLTSCQIMGETVLEEEVAVTIEEPPAE